MLAESLCNIANIKNTHLQQKDFVWISKSFNDIILQFLKKIAITNKTTQLPLRGESHIDFHEQSVIMTFGGWGISNDVLKFKTYINFQNLWIFINFQRIVHLFNHRRKKKTNIYNIKKNCEINQLLKLWARILRLHSSCPATVHIYSWTLWKNHLSVVSSSKKKQTNKQTNKKKQRKNTRTQARRQRKLKISNYNIQL